MRSHVAVAGPGRRWAGYFARRGGIFLRVQQRLHGLHVSDHLSELEVHPRSTWTATPARDRHVLCDADPAHRKQIPRMLGEPRCRDEEADPEAAQHDQRGACGDVAAALGGWVVTSDSQVFQIEAVAVAQNEYGVLRLGFPG